MAAVEFADLKVGMSAQRRFRFCADVVDRFAALVEDRAPVHCDAAFAAGLGFKDRIAHGFLVSSVFSGLLGQSLPGPRSVINSVSVKLHAPVYPGEELLFRVSVKQLAEAVRAVVLDLSADGCCGAVVVRGTATCSFPAAR